MPVYEYECQSCDEYFTDSKPMSQCDVLSKCPLCGVEARKLVSTPHTFITRPQQKSGKIRKHGKKLHEQTGIWYDNYKDLDKQAKARGLEHSGSAVIRDTHSSEVQAAKRKQKAALEGGEFVSRQRRNTIAHQKNQFKESKIHIRSNKT